MKMQPSWFGVLLAAYGAIWVAPAAIAKVIVVGEDVERDTRSGFKVYEKPSDIPPPPSSGYKVGQELPDNPTLNLPECVTLVVRAGDKFLSLRGPYKGPLSAFRDAGVQCDLSHHIELGERENVYDRYFQNICDKQKLCDTTCTAVFKLMATKNTKLKCP